jgi:AcrR family transcriptional regulator
MEAASAPANARGRRTRAGLLAAARRILEDDGFRALTMHAVAEQAGVTRRSVYLHFSSRAELVSALFDHVAEAEGLTASLAPVWSAPDAAAALDAWAAHVVRYHPRLIAVDRAVRSEAADDPDAAAHRARVARERLAVCRRLVERLTDERRLAAAWSARSAAEMLVYLDSSDLLEGLLVERRWSRTKLTSHYGALLRATFLAEPSAEAKEQP